MKIATDYANDDKIETYVGNNNKTTTVFTNLITGERDKRVQKPDGSVKETVLPNVKPKK
jgi:hypothetical protein